jgi:hypothetical protein
LLSGLATESLCAEQVSAILQSPAFMSLRLFSLLQL